MRVLAILPNALLNAAGSVYYQIPRGSGTGPGPLFDANPEHRQYNLNGGSGTLAPRSRVSSRQR